MPTHEQNSKVRAHLECLEYLVELAVEWISDVECRLLLYILHLYTAVGSGFISLAAASRLLFIEFGLTSLGKSLLFSFTSCSSLLLLFAPLIL